MQYGKILRSPHPTPGWWRSRHGEGQPIPASPGNLEGCGRNIFITNGFTPPKHHHLMDEYVRFVGTRWPWWWRDGRHRPGSHEAHRVKYQVLKPVFTIEEALAEDAPQLYPELPGNIAPRQE